MRTFMICTRRDESRARLRASGRFERSARTAGRGVTPARSISRNTRVRDERRRWTPRGLRRRVSCRRAGVRPPERLRRGRDAEVEDGVPARTGRESLASRRKGVRRQPVGTAGTARQAHGLTCQLIEEGGAEGVEGSPEQNAPEQGRGPFDGASGDDARPNHRPRRGGAGRGRRDGPGRIRERT